LLAAGRRRAELCLGRDILVGVTYVDGTPRANDFEMWIDDVRFIE
jgi:hypothetical protein